MGPDLERDIETIRDLPVVPTIFEVICKTTGMGFAAVARVTENRWIACQVLDNIDFGLKPGGELRVETTICNEIRHSRQAVVIDHVAEDPAFFGHPTPAMYGFQSYISMPIVLADGSFFGTLCAIDPRPARLKSSEIIGMFKLFAELIAVHVDARQKLIGAERELAEEQNRLFDFQGELLDARRAAELREQFIAVLGHDLRNPLASISSGVRMLLRTPQTDKARTVLTLMSASVQRMGGLIDNVLDFARGRLGGGITLNRTSQSLETALLHVLEEIRSAHPERDIRTRFDLARPFHGDHGRIAQLFSNLLGNAVAYGAEGEPIRVEASNGADGLVLAVANGGSPIRPEAIERLFQPFYRGEARSSVHGLGLGLFIASEIATAHGGRLEVSSSDEETRFVLRVPPDDAGAMEG